MGQKMIVQSEIRHRKTIFCDVTYLWDLKSDTHELICKSETPTHRKQTHGDHRRKDWGVIN